MVRKVLDSPKGIAKSVRFRLFEERMVRKRLKAKRPKGSFSKIKVKERSTKGVRPKRGKFDFSTLYPGSKR